VLETGSNGPVLEHESRNAIVSCRVGMKTEFLCTEETQGSTDKRCATNRIEQVHLDEVAQRKHVGIHSVHWDNKWMGSRLKRFEQNEQVEQLAGASIKQYDNKEAKPINTRRTSEH